MGFSSQWLSSSTSYTLTGKLANVIQPHYASESSPSFKTYTYDALDRLINILDQFGNNTTMSYTYQNIALTVQTTAEGLQTSQTMDATGKVVSASDASGTLTYQYDSYGNQTEVKLGSAVILQATYNSCNQKTSQTEPNSGTFNYSYDSYGELLQQTDADGKRTPCIMTSPED